MQNEIKVVMVEPHKNPTITKIKTKLENLQEAVGGLIEIIDIEDDVCILCNEEGKLIGLEGNRRLSDDILVGTFFVCGSNNEGELTSLTDSQIDKYIKFFGFVSFPALQVPSLAPYRVFITDLSYGHSIFL